MYTHYDSDIATKADNPAHHAWCRQFRPTCCDTGPPLKADGFCACNPCRAAFAAGQAEPNESRIVERTSIKRLQAENEQQLKADGLPSRAALYIHAIKTISQLRAENERLQAEVARLEKLLHRGLGKGM